MLLINSSLFENFPQQTNQNQHISTTTPANTIQTDTGMWTCVCRFLLRTSFQHSFHPSSQTRERVYSSSSVTCCLISARCLPWIMDCISVNVLWLPFIQVVLLKGMRIVRHCFPGLPWMRSMWVKARTDSVPPIPSCYCLQAPKSISLNYFHIFIIQIHFNVHFVWINKNQFSFLLFNSSLECTEIFMSKCGEGRNKCDMTNLVGGCTQPFHKTLCRNAKERDGSLLKDRC